MTYARPYLRATDYATYGADRPAGFIVEAIGYWNTDGLHYGYPAWYERGYSELGEVFPTIEAANAAIADSGLQSETASWRE